MPNPLIVIRNGRRDDVNDLLDIDIKCFENAWTPDEWAKVGITTDTGVAVAAFFGTPVGFCVFRRTENVEVEITKLAVKPNNRLQGISRELMVAVQEFAGRLPAEEIFIVVPESTIYPGPINTSDWLRALGFVPTKPFLKNHFSAYGEKENGVKFVLRRGK